MCTDHRTPCLAAQRFRRSLGASLIEVLLAIIVISVGVVGLLGTSVFALRDSADPVLRKQALSIGESLLSEILLKDFNNPTGGFSGAATPANRPFFDDVLDYNGYASTGAFTVEGIAIPALSAYNVAVTVTGQSLGTGVDVANTTNSRLVTVTVSYPGGQIAIAGYRLFYD
jgi:MSHA pilin protein MshD